VGQFSSDGEWDCTFTQFIGEGENLDTIDHTASAPTLPLAVTACDCRVLGIPFNQQDTTQL